MKEILIEERFERVKSIAAAAGIKVAAPKLDGVIAGSPLRVVRGGNRDEVVEQVRHEVQDIQVNLSDIGVIIRADTIGALEALSKELEGHQIQVMRAAVGPVTRHDVIEAGTIRDPLYSAIVAFNTRFCRMRSTLSRTLRCPTSAYSRAGSSTSFSTTTSSGARRRSRNSNASSSRKLVMPAKIRILPNCVFRQSNPAVVGVRVLGGKIQSGVDLALPNGKKVGRIKQIQAKNETVQEAEAGKEVAISIEGPTVGRQINVDDDLYVDVPERHVKVIEREMINQLSSSMRETLEEFTTLRRREDPFWGK
jgi:translation initiation factor 5B